MPILHPDNPEITSLKGLHVYHAGISNCSMRVRLALEEKGLAWISHPIDLSTQENNQPWYMAIHPKGLVPAIVHDGIVVTESNDILNYLEETFPEPALVPADPEQAAQTREWVDLAVALHVKAVKTWVYATTGGATKERSGMGHYAKIQPDAELVDFHQKALEGFTAEEIEAARKMLIEVFDRMEARLAKHDYLVGDAQSLADIAWFPQYVIFDMLGFDFRAYPAITGWANRQKARPSYGPAIGAWLPKMPGWLLRTGLKVRQLRRRKSA
ncbi:glutathione S-transferase family protein [Rhodalgimonas zhirmunskyi]|uniref:Glutathione S-transferase family protein n=1 Tax=Rhodalgimonas zhirmunskyi TaxID=2964767 RepID=A0AAJ1UC45_9RHOB|nr:glutathione S-transferase family protein [Rhodoalgimonas zhirmunskyi]MDQ2095158.1 glutathione S-transferase family protein [Rhodoalgimonas zhirmunskyi]